MDELGLKLIGWFFAFGVWASVFSGFVPDDEVETIASVTHLLLWLVCVLCLVFGIFKLIGE